jgi:hypothetical protein
MSGVKGTVNASANRVAFGLKEGFVKQGFA